MLPRLRLLTGSSRGRAVRLTAVSWLSPALPDQQQHNACAQARGCMQTIASVCARSPINDDDDHAMTMARLHPRPSIRPPHLPRNDDRPAPALFLCQLTTRRQQRQAHPRSRSLPFPHQRHNDGSALALAVPLPHRRHNDNDDGDGSALALALALSVSVSLTDDDDITAGPHWLSPSPPVRLQTRTRTLTMCLRSCLY